MDADNDKITISLTVNKKIDKETAEKTFRTFEKWTPKTICLLFSMESTIFVWYVIKLNSWKNQNYKLY
ncbi:hypothetical protein Avbf_12197 [Armadillidium vulgare]|nr:hypothetical protein Avbf_12197 [Armadillidium vulgare]